MNIIIMVFMALIGIFHTNAVLLNKDFDKEHCIDQESIVKPIKRWQLSSSNLVFQDNIAIMTLSFHNPFNTKNGSVDAKTVIIGNAYMPYDMDKYTLLSATFYNDKIIVNFKRIYTYKINNNKKGKINKIIVQTPCFERQIINKEENK